jgi:transcriptional regulator with XRE-family HTH domain
MAEEMKEGRSPFARILSRMLQESRLYTLVEWGDILGVRQSAISQWLHDKTLPRPEPLRMIQRVLEEHTDVPVDILADFEELINQPATDISPHGSKMGPTLGHYLIKPDWEAFERCVRPLSPKDQEEVLQAASSHAQKLAERAEEVEIAATIEGSGAEHYIGVAPGGRLTSQDIQRLKIEERDPNPSIWELAGHKQQELIQPSAQLRLVSELAPRFDTPTGLFAADERHHASLNQDVFNFAALPWLLPRELRPFNSFACSEMLLAVQQGTIEVFYDGIRPRSAVISGKPHAPGLLRMIAPPNWEHGLPPFMVQTLSDEPALALAVFYARDGLNLNRLDGASDRTSNKLGVELETQSWSEELDKRFWKESEAWGDLLPLKGNIPEDKDKLDQWMKDNPLSKEERKGRHRSARDTGQVEDCNWQEWLKGAAVKGIDRELGALHTRLLKFPAVDNLPEEEICGDAHEGSEILIPLRGAFNYLYARLENFERDSNFDTFGEFAESREQRGKSFKPWRGHAQSALVSGQKFSDIVFVESSAYHGFHAVGDDAYCLHIRCLADPNALLKRRRGERRSNVGTPARASQRRVA